MTFCLSLRAAWHGLCGVRNMAVTARQNEGARIMTNKHRQILTELFGGEFPGFVTNAGRNFLRIQLQDDNSRTVRLQDVLEFLAAPGEPGGGSRVFAGVPCDWGQAHFLVYMFHEYFKAVQR